MSLRTWINSEVLPRWERAWTHVPEAIKCSVTLSRVTNEFRKTFEQIPEVQEKKSLIAMLNAMSVYVPENETALLSDANTYRQQDGELTETWVLRLISFFTKYNVQYYRGKQALTHMASFANNDVREVLTRIIDDHVERHPLEQVSVNPHLLEFAKQTDKRVQGAAGLSRQAALVAEQQQLQLQQQQRYQGNNKGRHGGAQYHQYQPYPQYQQYPAMAQYQQPPPPPSPPPAGQKPATDTTPTTSPPKHHNSGKFQKPAGKVAAAAIPQVPDRVPVPGDDDFDDGWGQE
jgi:hypothetical protein